MRSLTVSRWQAVVTYVEVLICFWLLRFHRVVGAHTRVSRAGDGGQDSGRRCECRGGGLSCDNMADQRWRQQRLWLLLNGLLLLLLLSLFCLSPQLLPLALDDGHPVPYGLGHKLEVCFAHKAQHNLCDNTQISQGKTCRDTVMGRRVLL